MEDIAKKISVRLKGVSGWHRIRKLLKREYDFKITDTVTLLDTAAGSNNLGDEIIMKYAMKAIGDELEGQDVYRVASHLPASDQDIKMMNTSKAVIVCGTNFLSPMMEAYSVWKFDERMINMKNMVLLAVGSGGGYKRPSIYSRLIYRTLLGNEYLHSVRDQYTADMLNGIGIKNVINTNCVTLWGLDRICHNIPAHKSDKVVMTITGYMKDVEHDKILLAVLRRQYKEIYFWPQGDTDLQYLESIDSMEGIRFLDRTLKAYETVLEDDIDYVGSRLHGGIYALHHCKRTIILAVDNRATEIHRDTSIPVIQMSEVGRELENRISSDWPTVIHLNNEAVDEWKRCFHDRLVKG